MKVVKQIISFFSGIFSNYYFTFLLCFSIWMLFFDDNDVFSRITLWKQKHNLILEKEHYTGKIKQVAEEKHEILGTDKAAEKFARENYLMKKPTEEIFVIKKAQ